MPPGQWTEILRIFSSPPSPPPPAPHLLGRMPSPRACVVRAAQGEIRFVFWNPFCNANSSYDFYKKDPRTNFFGRARRVACGLVAYGPSNVFNSFSRSRLAFFANLKGILFLSHPNKERERERETTDPAQDLPEFLRPAIGGQRRRGAGRGGGMCSCLGPVLGEVRAETPPYRRFDSQPGRVSGGFCSLCFLLFRRVWRAERIRRLFVRWPLSSKPWFVACQRFPWS